MKAANEHANGTFPESARPAAAPIMLASWIPISKKRDGNALAKPSLLVDLERSASRTTTLGNSWPALTRASPNASRVALGFAVISFPRLPGARLEAAAHFGDRLVGLGARGGDAV